MKDNRESEQNRYSLFTVRNAKNAMTAFTIFAIAITDIIFYHALLIKHKLLITLNSITSSLSAVVGNVSSILSGATLLTILLEGADIMFFRRTQGERAKLREEKRELEKLKKEIQNLQKNVKPDTKPSAKSVTKSERK